MPQPCVDLVVEYEGGILLTRRQNEPAKGEWFWPGSRLYKGEGVETRHTIPVVYHVVPEGEQEIALDSQHDDYRVVTEPPEDANRYVREYFQRFDIRVATERPQRDRRYLFPHSYSLTE